MNKKIIISRYKEDFSWIKDYPYDYVVYNKGEPIEDNPHILNVEDIGENVRDICHFIWINYDDLPDIMVFLQGYPFDHCAKKEFDKLIHNEFLTPLEYYGDYPSNAWERRTPDGKFLEINNSWYINHFNNEYKQECKYSSFDEFMTHYFEDYVALDWVRFPPGAQIIVPKEKVLYYPRKFWETMMNDLNSQLPTEAHIVERSMWYIMSDIYKPRKEFYE